METLREAMVEDGKEDDETMWLVMVKLLVNKAAAALKLEMWDTAKEAAE